MKYFLIDIKQEITQEKIDNAIEQYRYFDFDDLIIENRQRGHMKICGIGADENILVFFNDMQHSTHEVALNLSTCASISSMQLPADSLPMDVAEEMVKRIRSDQMKSIMIFLDRATAGEKQEVLEHIFMYSARACHVYAHESNKYYSIESVYEDGFDLGIAITPHKSYITRAAEPAEVNAI